MSYVIRTKQSEYYLAKPTKIGDTVQWISLEQWMDWTAEPWEFETRAGADRARLMHSTRAETVYLHPPLKYCGTSTRGTWSGSGCQAQNLARIMHTDFSEIEARVVAAMQEDPSWGLHAPGL